MMTRVSDGLYNIYINIYKYYIILSLLLFASGYFYCVFDIISPLFQLDVVQLEIPGLLT